MSGFFGRIPGLARFFAPGTVALKIESPDITYRVAPVDALVVRR